MYSPHAYGSEDPGLLVRASSGGQGGSPGFAQSGAQTDSLSEHTTRGNVEMLRSCAIFRDLEEGETTLGARKEGRPSNSGTFGALRQKDT